jgi:hypothetical protein
VGQGTKAPRLTVFVALSCTFIAVTLLGSDWRKVSICLIHTTIRFQLAPVRATKPHFVRLGRARLNSGTRRTRASASGHDSTRAHQTFLEHEAILFDTFAGPSVWVVARDGLSRARVGLDKQDLDWVREVGMRTVTARGTIRQGDVVIVDAATNEARATAFGTRQLEPGDRHLLAKALADIAEG